MRHASSGQRVEVHLTTLQASALLALFYHGRKKLTRLHRIALRQAVTEITDAIRQELDTMEINDDE